MSLTRKGINALIGTLGLLGMFMIPLAFIVGLGVVIVKLAI